MTEMKKMMAVSVCMAVFSGVAGETALVDRVLPPAEGWSPIGFALAPFPGAELPGPGSDVDGFALALTAARNREINGLALAVGACWADGNLNGLAFSGIGNWYDGSDFGIHFASVLNYADAKVNGLQLAMVNTAYGVNGVQLGLVNCVSDGHGVQLGLWNLAEEWSGLQLGLVNMAMDCSGIQIGMGNIIGESPLTACILFNAWF